MDSTKHGLILDLNKYRSGYDLKQLMDAGADGFIFRIGGPSQWVEGDYKYQEDPSWRPYMDQARKLGILEQCGGYIVHNPFEDWHLQGVISNVHMNLLNQWTGGGYMPGYLILDHEINYCWRGATKIIVTPYNLVQSLASVTDQVWKFFKKVPVVYTGRWFIDQNGPTEHMTYLDNINRAETQRPMWYAAYKNPTVAYDNLKDFIEWLTPPSADFIGKYLQCGSYSLATLWQATDRLRLTGDATGCDASITWGTLAEYWAAVGVKATTPEPEPEPEPEPDPDPVPDDEWKTQVEARLAALEAFRANVNKA